MTKEQFAGAVQKLLDFCDEIANFTDNTFDNTCAHFFRALTANEVLMDWAYKLFGSKKPEGALSVTDIPKDVMKEFKHEGLSKGDLKSLLATTEEVQVPQKLIFGRRRGMPEPPEVALKDRPILTKLLELAWPILMQMLAKWLAGGGVPIPVKKKKSRR